MLYTVQLIKYDQVNYNGSYLYTYTPYIAIPNIVKTFSSNTSRS